VLHISWLALVEQKLAAAMAIPLDGLEAVDLVKEWQVDYDFQHVFAMSLGICNGTLMAEAMNLMSFLTPGSTLNGEDSPGQFSWNSGAKRSISMNSDVDSGLRYSNGQRSSHSDFVGDGGSFGQTNARNRATSMASGRAPHTPDLSSRGVGGAPMPNGSHLSRPSTSSGRPEEANMGPPRVSLDAPSPSLVGFGAPSPARPGSASTFFSAAPGPSQYASQPASGGSSIFSSAMPMSDSPATERNGGLGSSDDEPQALFTAASIYEFNIDQARQEGGIPYLTYVAGEIFDVIGERGELWLARNQDDAMRRVGWIWNKHFAKLAS
jgi:dynamin-binding protein